jgi:hypothetical protein
MNELLDLRQTGTVEEYTAQFQSLQYTITMHNAQYDEAFFTPQYIRGLKEDIRGVVEPQRPPTVHTASIIAKIQQGVQDKSKAKYQRYGNSQKQNVQPRGDTKPPTPAPSLWRDRQLRDYRKANNLCYSCGEKFVPGHMAVCPKQNKPQTNAIVANDLDRELSDEVLDELAVEDQLQEEFSQLSLNAITSLESANYIKLKTRVKDKVMLILVDSGSTHSFISSNFVQLANLPTIPIKKKKVRLANGESLVTHRMVPKLQCYCQGQSFTADMIVLDMNPYDAILGFDWLEAHSPMECDWQNKIIHFLEQGEMIKLQGLREQPLELSSISATKVYNATKGNDIWAFVLMDYIADSPPTASQEAVPPPVVRDLINKYQTVFSDPQTLPP